MTLMTSSSISKIIKVIDDIAFRQYTCIERGGGSGDRPARQGFAVVAEEVGTGAVRKCGKGTTTLMKAL